MSNNESSFATRAHVILSNIGIPLSQLIFTKITYTKFFIFQNKLISTNDVTLAAFCFN